MIALHKDPQGTTMFSKQQPASSSHSQRQHSRNFSLSGPKQTQDHSTVSDVESLRKRVNELESKLSAMHENCKCNVNGLDPA